MNNLSKGRSGQDMKIVCAWCGKDMGERDSEGIEGISHGVCEECLDKMEVKAGNGISAEDEPDE